MIKKIFLDMDVILDVALARKPFFEASKTVLALAENNIVIACISSNCIANIYYILRKSGGDKKARVFISGLLQYISVIPIDYNDIIAALDSKFTDFEDGIQNFSAIKHQCECLITRNIDDYENSEMQIYLPQDFLGSYKNDF